MKKFNTYTIEFEGKWQDLLITKIVSISPEGAKEKFKKEWNEYRILTIQRIRSDRKYTR